MAQDTMRRATMPCLGHLRNSAVHLAHYAWGHGVNGVNGVQDAWCKHCRCAHDASCLESTPSDGPCVQCVGEDPGEVSREGAPFSCPTCTRKARRRAALDAERAAAVCDATSFHSLLPWPSHLHQSVADPVDSACAGLVPSAIATSLHSPRKTSAQLAAPNVKS